MSNVMFAIHIVLWILAKNLGVIRPQNLVSCQTFLHTALYVCLLSSHPSIEASRKHCCSMQYALHTVDCCTFTRFSVTELCSCFRVTAGPYDITCRCLFCLVAESSVMAQSRQVWCNIHFLRFDPTVQPFKYGLHFKIYDFFIYNVFIYCSSVIISIPFLHIEKLHA